MSLQSVFLRGSPLVLALALAATMVISDRPAWQWFVSMDQRGDHYFNAGDYATAATYYTDPLRAGTAWFRAGDFKAAMSAFSRSSSPEAQYNLGNTLIMLGDYEDAVAAYDRALDKRPDWDAAWNNKEIARLRGARMLTEGGDMTGGQMAADDFVFDSSPGEGGENQAAEPGVEQTISDEQLQATWLRRVQTRPADFLQSRFAWQLAEAQSGSGVGSAVPAETDDENSPGVTP